MNVVIGDPKVELKFDGLVVVCYQVSREVRRRHVNKLESYVSCKRHGQSCTAYHYPLV
jgi:hypothetical protein